MSARALPQDLLWTAKMKQGTTELMARIGYTARGVVYMIVGGLAVLAAFGSGGETTGTKGALHTLVTQPFGYALLAVVALGLLCFTLWRLLQALLNVDQLGSDWKAAMRRTGFAASAAVNAALAVCGCRADSSDSRLKQATGRVRPKTGRPTCSQCHSGHGWSARPD